jgi:hypothetical protein
LKLIKSGIIQRKDIHHSKKYGKYSLKISTVEENLIYDDIERKGQLDPVKLDEDSNLLDGYLRDRLLGKLRESDIKYEQYSFEDEAEKIEYILSLNRMRRHYSEYQKCQMAKPLYEEEKKKAEERQKSGIPLGPKDLKGTATSIAARAAGTSGSTFKRFLDVEKSPELPKYEEDLIKGNKKIRTVSILVTRKDRNERKYPLPKTISDVFLGDLPYQYGDQGGKAAADEHYDTIPTPQLIKDFSKISAADNAISLTWWSPSFQYSEVPVYYDVPDSKLKVKVMIPAYKAILDAGGFKVINEFVWDKERMGVGSYNRNQHENLLIAVKGKMPVPAELFPSIIKKLRTTHSKKPNLWPMIKKMYPKRNYAELYARVKTPGVLYHGNQITVKTKEKSPIA